MPYRISFISKTDKSWEIFNNLEIFVNICFGIDIILNFFIAYFDENDILITSKKVIYNVNKTKISIKKYKKIFLFYLKKKLLINFYFIFFVLFLFLL